MSVLATWAPEDGVLGAVAPVALATQQPTALVVDLDPRGPEYASERSLRQLVEDGPRAPDLAPRRRGVAVVANGGIDAVAAGDILRRLISGWPAVVMRLPPQGADDVPVPVVPVRLLAPGRLFPPQGRGVYQPVVLARRGAVPGGSIVLPPAPRGTVAALLEGRVPAPGRWLRAWRRVWEQAW